MDLEKWKRKSVGNCRFIGELFKLDFLTERVMHSCIESLLKNSKDEHSLECMCQLLTTIGLKMDHEIGRNVMDNYFKRIRNMVFNKQTSSRIIFMLQDVIDLRAVSTNKPRMAQNLYTVWGLLIFTVISFKKRLEMLKIGGDCCYTLRIFCTMKHFGH